MSEIDKEYMHEQFDHIRSQISRLHTRIDDAVTDLHPTRDEDEIDELLDYSQALLDAAKALAWAGSKS